MPGDIAFLGHILHFTLSDIEGMGLEEYSEYLLAAERIAQALRGRS